MRREAPSTRVNPRDIQAARGLQGAPVAQPIPVQAEENGEGTNDTDHGEDEANEDAEEGETAEPVEAEVEEEAQGPPRILANPWNLCGQDCGFCDTEMQSPY